MEASAVGTERLAELGRAGWAVADERYREAAVYGRLTDAYTELGLPPGP